MGIVTPLKPATFRIDEDLLEALQIIKVTDGVPVSEQVRRGILMWLESKGVKADRKRASTRKRPSSTAASGPKK